MIIKKVLTNRKPLLTIVKREVKELNSSVFNIVKNQKSEMTIRPHQAKQTQPIGTSTISFAKPHVTNPRISHNIYYDLLDSGDPEKLRQAEIIFHDRTGLRLHCQGWTNLVKHEMLQDKAAYDYALEIIEEELKKGSIPDDIGHVVIGHGTGSYINNTWCFLDSFENVLDYCKRTMKDGKKALVLTCEAEGVGTVAGKPAIGHEVDTCFGEINLPAKIVQPELREIIGHFTTGEGIVKYRPELFK